MFLVNARNNSDLDKAETHVREGKMFLDANRKLLNDQECAKQLSKINGILSEIAKKRRVLAETEAENQ